jgi:integrase
VDLGGGRIVVQRALQRQRGNGLVFVEPKSTHSRRTVYLSSVAIAALREPHRQQTAERLAAGPAWQDFGLVFATSTGTPIDPPWVSHQLGRAIARASVPRVRVHDLQHTAATLLLARGVHPKVVQEMLGHSTISITLDTYSHTTPALHAEAATHMDALFGQLARS